MKKVIIISAFALPFILFFSCRHKPVLDSIPELTYEKDIRQQIIIPGCTHSGCHDTVGTGVTPMNTYDDIMSMGRVEAGSPRESKIYQAITGTMGQELMPKEPYTLLSDRNIQLIYIWIAQGAKKE
jgi:hypothetical protein